MSQRDYPMRHRMFAALLALLPSLAAAATGSTSQLKIDGLTVSVVKQRDGFEHLLVGKHDLLKTSYITLENPISLGTSKILIGFQSDGGNACEGSNFVLFFPGDTTAPTSIDGPLDTCLPAKYVLTPAGILFTVAPSPAEPGRQWLWAPGKGFGAPKSIPFTPDPASGWKAVQRHQISSGADLMKYADFNQLIAKTLGADQKTFITLSGTGSVGYQGKLMVSQSCESHNCADTGMLVVADPASRRLFIAMKDQNKPLIVTPNRSDWPAAVKPGLKDFTDRWN